jgi:hypothetical protein
MVDTSSKPKGDSENIDVQLEKRIAGVIRDSKDELENVAKLRYKFDTEKLRTMKRVGDRVNDLCANQPRSMTAKIVKEVAEGVGHSHKRVYEMQKVANCFTVDDIDRMTKAGVGVAIAQALVSIKDEKQRKELLEAAIEGTISKEEIMVKKGAKGKRKDQGTERAVNADKKLKPKQVLLKTEDKIATLSDALLSSNDAIGRMDDLSDDEYQATTAEVCNMRERLKALKEEVNAFLTHTKAFEKKAK